MRRRWGRKRRGEAKLKTPTCRACKNDHFNYPQLDLTVLDKMDSGMGKLHTRLNWAGTD